MFWKRSIRPTLVGFLVILSLALGACGGDTDSDASDVNGDTGNADATNQASDGGAADPSDAGDPMGTATIDGTEYTIVASLQCLVAIEQANQISISGDVVEYESDEPFEWQYSWDSDDGINEFSIQVGDDPADEYRAMGTFSDPQVNGQSITASGTVMRGVDTLDASIEMDCS